ncbi:MAG TPA: hypothetical protein VGK87_11730 [Anaerolineae bacterium]|jgi:uncharacterized membrane protein YqaE (UPF0057 family)
MTQEPEHRLPATDITSALAATWRPGAAWLVPGWATVCGFIAAKSFAPNEAVVALISLFITVGLWPALWSALAETDWSKMQARWRAWDTGEPLKPLPYAVPDSDAAQLAVVLGKFRAFLVTDLLPTNGVTVATIVLAPAIALTLSAVVGTSAILLTIVAICIPQLAVLFSRGKGQPSPILQALLVIALPILMGYSLTHTINLALLAVAVGCAIAVAGASTWRTWTWNAGLMVVFVLLVVTRHPVGAFGVGLMWLPQFIAQAQPQNGHVVRWLYLCMLLATYTVG